MGGGRGGWGGVEEEGGMGVSGRRKRGWGEWEEEGGGWG